MATRTRRRSLERNESITEEDLSESFLTTLAAQDYEEDLNSLISTILFPETGTKKNPDVAYLLVLANFSRNFSKLLGETRSRVCCEFVDQVLKEVSPAQVSDPSLLQVIQLVQGPARRAGKLVQMIEAGDNLVELKRLATTFDEPICVEYFVERLRIVARRWDACVTRGEELSAKDRGLNDALDLNIRRASHLARLLVQESRGLWTSSPEEMIIMQTESDDSIEFTALEAADSPLVDSTLPETVLIEQNVHSLQDGELDSGEQSIFDRFARKLTKPAPQLVVTSITDSKPKMQVDPDTSPPHKHGFESLLLNQKPTDSLADLEDRLVQVAVAIRSFNESALLGRIRLQAIREFSNLRHSLVLADLSEQLPTRILDIISQQEVKESMKSFGAQVARLVSLQTRFQQWHWDNLHKGEPDSRVREVMVVMASVLEGLDRFERSEWLAAEKKAMLAQGINDFLLCFQSYVDCAQILFEDDSKAISRICSVAELVLDAPDETELNAAFVAFRSSARFMTSWTRSDPKLRQFFFFL